MKNKVLEKQFELPPEEWLSWSDEKFNNWRREHDFPRIFDFLSEALPYFFLWLSEQSGLTREDLIFHGPARFIKPYGKPIKLVEHDAGINLPCKKYHRQNLRHYFISNNEIEPKNLKITRFLEFSSYIDWAYKNRNLIFKKTSSNLEDFIRCLTPSGRSCNTSTYINSDSSIQFNIPFFMPSINIKDLFSATKVNSPPHLKLLKLGGGGITIKDGVIGEKNLEFTNLDNITLNNPIITSFQNITYSTLRNFHIIGDIHAAKFHQCIIEINIIKGSLSQCDFENCESTISLNDSKLCRSSIREKRLRLKLKDTEISDCHFEYTNPYNEATSEREIFHQTAKITYSHLGYPDLAGKHFYLEQQGRRKELWNIFSNTDKKTGLKKRTSSLLGYTWMALQEAYWGYGERPFNVILFSLFTIISFSLFGYLNESSSTQSELGDSLIFSFQAFTNITIKDVNQASDTINLVGSFMSFFGLMSVGLLVAALSAKTKDYN